MWSSCGDSGVSFVVRSHEPLLASATALLPRDLQAIVRHEHVLATINEEYQRRDVNPHALNGNAVNDFPAGKRGVGNVAAVARPRVHPE